MSGFFRRKNLRVICKLIPSIGRFIRSQFTLYNLSSSSSSKLYVNKDILLDSNVQQESTERLTCQKWKIRLPFHPPNQPQEKNTSQIGMNLEKTTKVMKIVVRPEVRPNINNTTQSFWKEPCIQMKSKHDGNTTRREEKYAESWVSGKSRDLHFLGDSSKMSQGSASRDSLEQYRVEAPVNHRNENVMLEKSQNDKDARIAALILEADIDCQRQVNDLVNLPLTPGQQFLLSCGGNVAYDMRKNAIEAIQHRNEQYKNRLKFSAG
jgi:hypothetical protein